MSNDVMTADDATYPYKGVPLTPAIAQFLIEKLFAGKIVERQIVVDEVLRAHLAGGGLKASAKDVTATIKQALGDMKERGAAGNPSLGYWRINQSPSVQGEGVESTAAEMSRSVNQIGKPEPVATAEPAADVELGFGHGSHLRLLLTDLSIAGYRTGRESVAMQNWTD